METISPKTKVSVLRTERPMYTYKDGSEYTGSWRGGFRDGYGVMVWYDGSRYEGQWSFGKAFQSGRFVYFDDEEFDGRWGNDKLSVHPEP